jgi:hypothetical protein
MNEVNAEQLQSIFGTVANIEREVKSQQRVIEKTAHVLGDKLPDITRHLTVLRDVKDVVNELVRASLNNKEAITTAGEKTVDELNKINTNIVSTNKEIGKNINDELNKYGTKQEQTIDKLESTLSSNFKTVSDTFLSRSQEGKEDPFKQYIDSIVTVLGGKLDNMTSSIAQLKDSMSVTNKSGKVEVKGNASNILKQQINILNSFKSSSDKKLTSIFEAITGANQRTAAREKKEKTTPPEINLSRKDRRLLTSLDNATKFDALLHEVKDSKKADGKSPLLKLISPLMLLLGGVGALAFGVFKFPTVKKMFDTFTKTSMGGGIMSFFQSLGPKNKSVKEIIRNIPFVGRMVDLWDALSLMHKGNYKAGFKQLAFAIPGAEYLALLLDTTKERLLSSAYDKAGDKSVKIPFIGATAEQLFNGIFGGISGVFQPVISFFRDGFGALGDVFNVLKKGVGVNYNDVATALDSISTNYFPSLKPVAEIFKSLAKSSFDWTAAKMGVQPDAGKEIKPINIGDLFNTVFETISEKITKTFETLGEVMSALGMVFSGDTRTQQRGLNILDRYAPGISNGIGTFLNVLDSIKEMGGADGKIDAYDMIMGKGISMEGKFSKRDRYKSVMSKEGNDALDQYEALTAEIKALEETTDISPTMQNVTTMSGGMPSMYSIMNRTVRNKDREEEIKKKIKAKKYERTVQLNKTVQHGMPFEYFFPGTGVKDKSWLSMEQSDVNAMQPELFTRENNPATAAKIMEASPFKRLNQAPDKFEMQTNTYRGNLEKDKQESKQQFEIQEKLYQLINGPVLNMLKESAHNGKAQVSHLEQTSKGIASLGNAPRNNVVVSSVKNSINSFGGTNTLNAKANALGAMGITV